MNTTVVDEVGSTQVITSEMDEAAFLRSRYYSQLLSSHSINSDSIGTHPDQIQQSPSIPSSGFTMATVRQNAVSLTGKL